MFDSFWSWWRGYRLPLGDVRYPSQSETIILFSMADEVPLQVNRRLKALSGGAFNSECISTLAKIRHRDLCEYRLEVLADG